MIVPFPPGGPTDAYARMVAAKMQERWGQPVVVENKPGGTGVLGNNLVIKSPPNGYTLLFTSNSAHLISVLLKNPKPYDSIKDFTPISIAIKYPMYLLINPNLPVKTVPEFIAYAKANSGKLNYSSVGQGSGGHLACELFNIAAGTNITHVPYKGASSAQASTIAGDTQMFCDSVGNSQPMVEQSTAPQVSPVHFGVMTSWNALTRIVGIAAKDVVPLDLFWFEELHSLEVL